MKHNMFKSVIFVVACLIILTGCRKQDVSKATTEPETQQESVVSTNMPEETETEETVYYGQSEISKDDIVFVPHVTVEIPEESTSEADTD